MTERDYQNGPCTYTEKDGSPCLSTDIHEHLPVKPYLGLDPAPVPPWDRHVEAHMPAASGLDRFKQPWAELKMVSDGRTMTTFITRAGEKVQNVRRFVIRGDANEPFLTVAFDEIETRPLKVLALDIEGKHDVWTLRTCQMCNALIKGREQVFQMFENWPRERGNNPDPADIHIDPELTADQLRTILKMQLAHNEITTRNLSAAEAANDRYHNIIRDLTEKLDLGPDVGESDDGDRAQEIQAAGNAEDPR
jgi:hypothetical protein